MRWNTFFFATYKKWSFRKPLLMIRLSMFAVVITLTQVSAAVYSQRISLNEINSPLQKILRSIERQSGYVFFYDLGDVNRNVSVQTKNASLEEALKQVLKGVPLDYKIVGKTIVFEKKPISAETGSEEKKGIIIKGRITDNKGVALIGATVRTKTAGKGTSTDTNGYFELRDVEANEILIISYTGYVSKEIMASDAGLKAIVLEEDQQQMNTVVVVGYGTQKKVNLTGAVSQVSGADIGLRATSGITNSLQGLLPGLNVQANTGNPGDKPEINIRGFNSVNGGSPLVLIDGIQGDIDRLNPLDVESVTVLKDAASSAIYGARGAFGVILITTKKGKEGRISVNYTNNFGSATPVVRTDFITDPYLYGKTIDASLFGYNGTTYTTYTEAEYETIQKVAAGELEPFHELQPNGTYKFFHKTNWYDLIYRRWQPSSTHNISVSGGNDKIQGHLSARAYNIATIQNIVDANLTKYNIRGNLNFKINNWLELSNNIQVSAADQTEYGGTRAGYGGVFSTSSYFFLWPFMPHEIDGIPYDFNGNGQLAALEGKGNFIRSHSEQLVNIISAKITPVKDLVFNIDYSNTINHIVNTSRLNTFNYLSTNRILPQTGGVNNLTEGRDRNYYNALNIFGTYSRNLFNGNHHVKLLLGYNQEKYNADNILAQQGGLLVSSLSSLNLGTTLLQATGSGSIWALRGYFGRFNYDYKNKYLLEINGRYDGSSRFPSVSRYGFFPSVSAGWYISNEKFFKPLEQVISSLKLRLSYGKLGNQNIDLYTFSEILSTGRTSWLTGGSQLNYAEAPPPLPGVVSWETSKTINFGADLGFLNNRLTVSLDVYEKNISGMYVSGQPLPGVFGASEPKENIAGLRNRGFELSLGYNTSFIMRGSPFRIRTSVNLYNFEGVITRYPNPNGLMSAETFWEGQKLGEIYGYHVDGQFQSDEEAQAYQAKFANPSTSLGQVYNYELSIVQNTQWKGLRAGDIRYVDVNGDGAINKGNNTLSDHGDLISIGNAMPKLPFGFTLFLDWKNFDLSLAGTGVVRQDWYPTGNIYWGPYERPYLSFIRKDLVSNAWTPDHPENTYPQIYRGYASLGARRSLGEVNDYYLTNIGYLRIKNLTLGYTLPQKLVNKAHIQNLRLYFSGENILTWRFGDLTRYIDPETAGSGIDYSNPGNATTRARAGESYPIGKIYSFGLSLTL